MSWQIEQLLPAGSGTPNAARTLARRELAEQLGPDRSALIGGVVLVLSELVTNAVLAGSRSVGVAFNLSDEQLRVEVTDDGTGWPHQRPTSTDSLDGRGLAIVAALADEWGAKPVRRGKAVWATFTVPGS